MRNADVGYKEKDMTQRLTDLRVAMREKKIDALLVTAPHHVAYLSGFRGLAHADAAVQHLDDPEAILFVTKRNAAIIADRRSSGGTRGIAGFRSVTATAGVTATIASLARQYRTKRCGIEADALTVADATRLRRAMYGTRLLPADRLLNELRRHKDTSEIANLRAACAATDRAFAILLRRIRIGMTELAVQHLLTAILHDESDGLAFTPIVAAGAGAAIPHYAPTTKKLQRGEMLLLDFGARVNGYCADMTRTVSLGRANARLKKIYALVAQAQERGIVAVRVGAHASEADDAVRAPFRIAKLERHFLHATGHGVGLRVHEAPSLSPRSSDLFSEHMVCTVEPGLYFPGWGGVRIEDVVHVTTSGPKLLTTSPKKLIEI